MWSPDICVQIFFFQENAMMKQKKTNKKKQKNKQTNKNGQ